MCVAFTTPGNIWPYFYGKYCTAWHTRKHKLPASNQRQIQWLFTYFIIIIVVVTVSTTFFTLILININLYILSKNRNVPLYFRKDLSKTERVTFMNQIEKQVHSFLYQNQLIASGYIVNISRDNRSREVGVKIKNHKHSERCYWMFRDGISIRNVAQPVNLVSTECDHHLHECMQPTPHRRNVTQYQCVGQIPPFLL